MNAVNRSFGAGLAWSGLVLAAVAAGGCKDRAAERRKEVQQHIETASRALQVATLTTAGADETSAAEVRRSLEKVLTELRETGAGDAGQQASAALLVSAANRELAGLNLARAEQLEGKNRMQRELLYSRIGAATRLVALAAGVAGSSTNDPRAELAGARTAAEQRLDGFRQKLGTLDGPIDERVNENEQDATEAARLQDEAVTLRQEAASAGHFEGLAAYQHALALEREADEHEYKIAMRETDLQYELRPEHEFAGSQVAYLRSMLADIKETEDALHEHDRQSREQVDELRAKIGAYRRDIDAALNQIRTEAAGDLEAQYEEATGRLETAIARARQAARDDPDSADAARLALVRASVRSARLHAARARGLAGHVALLERLAAGGDRLADAEAIGEEIAAARAAGEASLQTARDQLTAAREALDQVRGKAAGTEVEHLKQSLAAQLDGLAGKSEGGRLPPAAGTSARTPAPPAEDAGSSADGGFASIQGLLEALRSTGAANSAGQRRLLAATRATSPAARTVLDLQGQLIGPLDELTTAIRERFGAIPPAMQAALGGAGPAALADAHVVEEDEDSAVIEFTPQPTMPSGRLDLIRVGRWWFVDGDALTRDLNPALVQQMKAVSGVVSDLFHRFAGRVRKGEFDSAQQAGQAFMSELAGMAGGGQG